MCIDNCVCFHLSKEKKDKKVIEVKKALKEQSKQQAKRVKAQEKLTNLKSLFESDLNEDALQQLKRDQAREEEKLKLEQAIEQRKKEMNKLNALAEKKKARGSHAKGYLFQSRRDGQKYMITGRKAYERIDGVSEGVTSFLKEQRERVPR